MALSMLIVTCHKCGYKAEFIAKEYATIKANVRESGWKVKHKYWVSKVDRTREEYTCPKCWREHESHLE